MTPSNTKWTFVLVWRFPIVAILIDLLARIFLAFFAFCIIAIFLTPFAVCRTEESGDVALHFQEYILKESAVGSLRVVVEVREEMEQEGDGSDYPMEKFLLKFYRVSPSGRRKLVAQEVSRAGMNRIEDWTQVDNFLGNGRRQVLTVVWDNCAYGKIYDFDGQRVRTVYNTENYDGSDFDSRTYLSCLHLPDGQAGIQEEFHEPNSNYPLSPHQKAEGFTHVKGESCLMRVMRWSEGGWRPVNSATVASILPP